MDLDDCRLFLDVARRGSFAAVARERDTDPSSVSRRVARLEAALGCRLFDRSTRRLAPTESGALLAERLDGPLDALDAAFDLARGLISEPEGTLRVGASIAFGERWLVPRLGDFRARHPRIRVELVLDDAPLDLVAARLDVALRLGNAMSGPWVASRLLDTRYRVVASPDYLARRGTPAAPDALPEHDCIVFPFAGFRSCWRFRGADGGGADAVEVPDTLVISSALAIRRAALDGHGLALLADWLIGADVAAGGLVDVFPDREASAKDFDTAAWVLYPSREHLPAKVGAFVDFVRERRAA